MCVLGDIFRSWWPPRSGRAAVGARQGADDGERDRGGRGCFFLILKAAGRLLLLPPVREEHLLFSSSPRRTPAALGLPCPSAAPAFDGLIELRGGRAGCGPEGAARRGGRARARARTEESIGMRFRTRGEAFPVSARVRAAEAGNRPARPPDDGGQTLCAYGRGGWGTRAPALAHGGVRPPPSHPPPMAQRVTRARARRLPFPRRDQ